MTKYIIQKINNLKKYLTKMLKLVMSEQHLEDVVINSVQTEQTKWLISNKNKSISSIIFWKSSYRTYFTLTLFRFNNKINDWDDSSSDLSEEEPSEFKKNIKAFIPVLTEDKKTSKLEDIIMAADFESIALNDKKHVVYGIGLMHYSNLVQFKNLDEDFLKKHSNLFNKDVTYKSFFLEKEEEFDITTIQKESYRLIYRFLNYLIELIELERNKRTNSKSLKCYIYMHNLGGYDGRLILEALSYLTDCSVFSKSVSKSSGSNIGSILPIIESLNMDEISLSLKLKSKIDVLYRDGNIYYIKLHHLVFYDSMNLLRFSLNQIGSSFLGEKKLDFDTTSVKDYNSFIEKKDEIEKYLYRDVDILFKSMTKLYQTIFDVTGLSILKHFTISGIALAYYRKKYLLDYQIEITRGLRYEFIQESYYGGLCNVLYTMAEKGGYGYDVNSLYPHIMKTNYFPVGKGVAVRLDDIINNDISDYFGYIKCDVYIPKDITLSPLISYWEKTTAQHTGYVEGVWFTEEIKNALQLGCSILKIYYLIHYNEKAKIFENYITELYNKRTSSSSEVENQVYKLLMNSLYGRLGMNNERTCIEWNCSEERLSLLKEMSEVEQIGKLTLIKPSYNLYKNYMTLKHLWSQEKLSKIEETWRKLHLKDEFGIYAIQLASAISAYSRMRLVNDITHHIKKNKAIVYYYDTDSIFTNIKLDDNICDNSSSKELGKYKLDKTFSKGLFLAPKAYILLDENGKEKHKMKGVPSKYDNYTYEDYKKCLHKDFESLEYSNMERAFVKTKGTWEINKTSVTTHLTFESLKYDKVYNEEDLFYKTQPLFVYKHELFKKKHDVFLFLKAKSAQIDLIDWYPLFKKDIKKETKKKE